MDIENLLREPKKHKRKKSFQRHFEKKILRPKLALTFHRENGIKEMKKKYIRPGRTNQVSDRLGERTKGNKRKIFPVQKVAELFSSQKLNMIKKKSDPEYFEAIKDFPVEKPIKNVSKVDTKLQSRKVFRKYRKSETINFSKNKEQFSKESKRTKRPKGRYHISFVNNRNSNIRNGRVKLKSMKSYSRVDNNPGIEPLDKFFKVFKKKRDKDGNKPSIRNIYKDQSKFKSIRQLPNKNIKQANRKKKSMGGEALRVVFSESKPKAVNSFEKLELWSEGGFDAENIAIYESIYNPQIYNSQPIGPQKKLMSKESPVNDKNLKKFNDEYIKIKSKECSEFRENGSLVGNQSNDKAQLNPDLRTSGRLKKVKLVDSYNLESLYGSNDKMFQPNEQKKYLYKSENVIMENLENSELVRRSEVKNGTNPALGKVVDSDLRHCGKGHPTNFGDISLTRSGEISEKFPCSSNGLLIEAKRVKAKPKKETPIKTDPTDEALKQTGNRLRQNKKLQFRKSEHGIPLKMNSFRDRKNRLSRIYQARERGEKPYGRLSSIQTNLKGTSLYLLKKCVSNIPKAKRNKQKEKTRISQVKCPPSLPLTELI